jgi:hypothetical protein
MNWMLVLLSLIATGEMNRGITAEVWDAYPYDTQDYDIVDEEPLPLRVVYKGDTYDSLSFRLLLPPQTAFVMRCDPGTRTLADTLAPDYGLCSEAEDAVAAAPAWLRPDLVDNLIQVTEVRQKALASLILNPRDERFRDEIAFQIAHISPVRLLSIDLAVITENVDSLFAIDDELAYVEIIDYGDPETDDDYYSTTQYTTLDNGFHSTFEIPREIYYWYVIMPRITDEVPRIIYDKFWREYLYYDNGTESYTEGGYPLLRDVLEDITYIWDGERHVWAADRALSPDMCALDAIGWWVSRVLPSSASSPRPIQPNQIATDHDGNCGETQDLYCAGLRTGLIPALGTMNINEDHVWNAFWWPSDFSNTDEGIWHECQVDLGGGVTHAADSNTSYDDDRTGSSKHCSCIWNWRADGYQWSTIPMYSDYCTLTVTVYDNDGNPVPNTDIKLSSEGWHTLQLWKGFSGITDRNGVFMTTLGEEQNYTAAVYMQSMGRIIDSASALAGEHFSLACTLTTDYKPKPRELKANPYPPDPVPDLNLALQVEAEYDLGHCPTYSYEEKASKSAVKFKQGRLTDFFVTDHDGLSDFLRELNFNTYGHFPIEGSLDTAFSVPLDKTCYLVFFNNYGEFGEVISGKVSLIESTDVAEAPGADEHLVLEVMSFASGKGTIMFSLPAAAHACLDVFDLSGRKVTTLVNGQLTAGKHEVYWNGLDNKGAVLSNGVYFISLAAEDSKLIYKTVIVR